MAVSFIQEANFASTPAATTIAVTVSSTQAGSLLVVGAANSAGNPITSVTDNQLNTYLQIGSQINDGGHQVSLWYCINATAGVTSITSHQLSSGSLVIYAAEYSGTFYGIIGTHGAFDATATLPIDSGSFQTGVGNLIVGFAFSGSATSGGSLQNFRDNTSSGNFAYGDTTGAVGGNFDVTFGQSVAATWACIGAAFATPGPGGPFSDQIIYRKQVTNYRRSAFYENMEFTQFVIIPSAASWNTDYEKDHQLAQSPSNSNIASDQGLDWTNTILLPPFDPTQGNTEDDPSDNQKSQLPAVGNLASDSGQDSTGFIILPPLASLLDDGEIRQQLDRSVNAAPIASDSGQDSTGFIILPSAASWNTDTDKDNQLAQAASTGNLASDAGQDTTNFLIIPSFDPSLGNTEDDPSDNQLDRSVNAAQVASDAGSDTTNLIILPPMVAAEEEVGSGEDE